MVLVLLVEVLWQLRVFLEVFRQFWCPQGACEVLYEVLGGARDFLRVLQLLLELWLRSL